MATLPANTAQPIASRRPWFARNLVLVPLLLFVAPVGAVLMWGFSRWPLWLKALWTPWALFSLLIWIGVGASGGTVRATPEAGQDAPPPVAAAPTAPPAAPAAAAPQPTAAPPPTPVPQPTAPPAPPQLPGVGQRVESGGVAITVANVARVPALGQFMRAGEGKVYLNVEVVVESPGRDTSPYNPLYFRVRDADGFEYNGSLVGDDRSLKSGELRRGEIVRGTVAFEVPTASRGFVVAYQPLVIFGGYQTIRIALG